MQITIGVDIGGTNVRIVACDEKNSVVAERKIHTEQLASNGNTISVLISLIKEFIEALKGNTILAIGMGFPSTLNRERTLVLNTPNATGLNHISREWISKELGHPVYFEKDANMLLLNDQYVFHFDPMGIVIGIYFGTGIGNAIMVNGNFITGKNGVACELGHIPCMGKKRPCSCGNKGCLEEYGGGKALERMAKEHFGAESVKSLFVNHGEDKIILDFVENMAIAVATEVNILDPDTVMIGGGVVHMQNFPAKYFEDCIRRFTRKPFPCNNLNLIYSDDGEYNGAKGAATFARVQSDVKK